MTAFAFKHSSSTVDFIRQLKEAKFTDNQIQVLAKHSEEQTQQIEHVLEGKELSSKNDLELVRLSLQNDIKVAELKPKRGSINFDSLAKLEENSEVNTAGKFED